MKNKTKKSSYWRYVTAFLEGIFTLVIILLIFSSLSYDSHVIIVGVVILVYLSLSSLHVNQNFSRMLYNRILHDELEEIKMLLREDFSRDVLSERAEASDQQFKPYLINLYLHNTFITIGFIVTFVNLLKVL